MTTTNIYGQYFLVLLRWWLYEPFLKVVFLRSWEFCDRVMERCWEVQPHYYFHFKISYSHSEWIYYWWWNHSAWYFLSFRAGTVLIKFMSTISKFVASPGRASKQDTATTTRPQVSLQIMILVSYNNLISILIMCSERIRLANCRSAFCE